MNFSVKESNFYLGDKKVFLNSGEIHYFRIKRELWDKHLEAAKEAGLSTISTYIPWAWHEPEESVFDFEGTTCPERDLKGWLERCQAYGLNCIVKPGPFILAEFRGAGLPDWFLEEYREQLKMRNSRGEIFPSDGVSLFNIKYLEKVGLWYDKIMPFISEREISSGGNIIMMQICNEIGVFSWLAKQADYSNAVKQRFVSYLACKFNDIAALNVLWDTNYLDFNDVELPPDGKLPYQSKADRARDREWHCFWRTYYGDYLRMLTSMARARGVSVPLYHNLPGWIYGNGYEFPVNITMYEDLYRDKSEIVFGVDHIPEFVSYRNMHDDRIINDITHAMQGDKPLFAAEFQCGSREYHVVTNPRELELFYKASIANGLQGWNYYMFSQGRNASRKGYSGETFYWFNPLNPEADKGSAFPLIKRMSRIIKSVENIIVNAKRRTEVCVLFYPPYYATELERPLESGCEIVFNPSSIRRPAYFDGLLKVLQVLNIDYNMEDLSQVSAETLKKYKQVWAFCTDEMNAREQQVIVDYTKSGGNVVIFPYLPDREMSQIPCTIIRDALSVSPSGMESVDSPLVDIYGFRDIKCANPQITFDEASLDRAEIIARTIRGSVCGFSKSVGNGSLLFLGTWIGFDTEGHKPVYEAMLESSGAKLRQAWAGNESITVRERFADDNSALLFIGNYYNEDHTSDITYTHPASGDLINIPYLGGKMNWPALYSVLTPVCLVVSEGLSILHGTSDILSISDGERDLEIILYGNRDLAGEIVLEGGDVNKIDSVTVDGKNANIVLDEKRIIVTYSHLHRIEMTLNIRMK
ncbi:MAG: beta-galactosidase [Bacteroidota bacterium]